jgi:hypothetical protein
MSVMDVISLLFMHILLHMGIARGQGLQNERLASLRDTASQSEEEDKSQREGAGSQQLPKYSNNHSRYIRS